MARTETKRTVYIANVHDGLLDCDESGKIEDSSYPDEPWGIRLIRREVTKVEDARGRRWSEGSQEDEVLDTLTLEQASGLAVALIEALGWASEIGERRVLKAPK